MTKRIIAAFLALLNGLAVQAQKQAELFATGVISNGSVFGLTITPDGNTAYFVNSFGGRQKLQVMESKKTNGVWRKPTPAFFSDLRFREIDPFVAPDGNSILYNTRKKQQKDASDDSDLDIWMVKRVNGKWDKPFPLTEINSDENETYATMAANGNIYFGLSSETKGYGGNDIYVSRLVNGKYEKPSNLGYPINSTMNEGNCFVAPDESYIIFSSDAKASSFGQSDLYISFNNCGTWSIPINLGHDINSDQNDFCPAIFSSNKLIFARSQKIGDALIENIYSIGIDIPLLKAMATLHPTPVFNQVFQAGDVYGITFSHDGKHAYTTRSNAERSVCEVYRFDVGSDGSFSNATRMDTWQLTSNVANPVVSHDGSFALLRISSGKGNPDIYISAHRDGVWMTPEPIAGDVNTEQDEYYPELTSDNKLYYSRSGDVYTADFIAPGWGNAKPVRELNTELSESNIAVSRDGKWLVFLSNRTGSYGSYDLFISKKTETGWSKPLNLGPNINTNAMEYQPRFSLDDKTLYFTRSVFSDGKRQGKEEVLKIEIAELLEKLGR
jgi:Tol biopolymer transport system component